MAKDYAEILLEAVDLLSAKRLESLRYDRTETATIVDNSKAKQGEYVVSTGQVRYTAYSEKTNYRIDDVVYVTIPNGDYDE